MLLLPMLELLETDEEKSKFQLFYYKYKNLVMYISLQRLKNFHLAEENCQDVFFALAKHFDKVGEIDSQETKGYVYTVATGFAINKYNKEINKQPKNEIYKNYADISDENFDLYNVTEIKIAVDGLSDVEKEYFRLKYLYGFTSKEIGEMFNESPSNVRRKMQIIKSKLKERLGDNDE